jgi:hypothetical protein
MLRKTARQAGKEYVVFPLLTGPLAPLTLHHREPAVPPAVGKPQPPDRAPPVPGPSRRYPQIAAEVREICERHHLPYNTASLSRQLGSVVRKIFRLALPRAGG